MNTAPDSLLCRIAGQTAAVHWLPTGEPMNGPTLNDVLCFAWTLPDAGLPFQARSRDDRAALDDLRRRGLVDVQGQTSGVHVRLTLAGAACFWHLDVAAETAAALAGMEKIRTPWGADVVPGFVLCPAAGDWWAAARATDGAWFLYLDELAEAITALTPLLVLGWARQYVSGDQQFWAVTVTDAGRQAATATHPDMPRGFRFDADAYATGRNEGKRRFGHNPPDAGSSVAMMLPASRWPGAEDFRRHSARRG